MYLQTTTVLSHHTKQFCIKTHTKTVSLNKCEQICINTQNQFCNNKQNNYVLSHTITNTYTLCQICHKVATNILHDVLKTYNFAVNKKKY